MVTRLYVAKSSSLGPDVKAKNGDKVPGPRRSVRRRGRLNDLSNALDRERARQRAAFIASYVNSRNNDDDQPTFRDRQTTSDRTETSDPLRSRADYAVRSPSSYIGSLLDSIQSGTLGLRDWNRGDDGEAGLYSLSVALAGEGSSQPDTNLNEVGSP
jgi:hypothetical protein